MELKFVQMIKGNEFQSLTDLQNYLNNEINQGRNINISSVIIWAQKNYKEYVPGASFFLTSMQLLVPILYVVNGSYKLNYILKATGNCFDNSYIQDLNLGQLRSILPWVNHIQDQYLAIKLIAWSRGNLDEKIKFLKEAQNVTDIKEVFGGKNRNDPINKILYAVGHFMLTPDDLEYTSIITQEVMRDMEYTKYLLTRIRTQYLQLPETFIQDCKGKYENALANNNEEGFEEI